MHGIIDWSTRSIFHIDTNFNRSTFNVCLFKFMHIRLICLLLVLTSSSQASISNATIASDAAEILRLNERFLSSSPAVIRRNQATVCEMINTCCPSVKSRLEEVVSNFTTGASNALLKLCMGNQYPQYFLKTCPTTSKFLSIVQEADFFKYAGVLITAAGKIEIPVIKIQRPCSSEEAYAAFCEQTKRKLLESCERKTLFYVSQHNSIDEYQTYVRKTKANLRLLISMIKSAFPMKKITSKQ